jgi:hypothetical protein
MRAAILAVALSFIPSTANAQLEEIRYKRILTHFEDNEKAYTFWWYGWAGFYLAAAVGQGTLGLLTDREGPRADAIVGTIKATLGFLGIVVLAPRAPITTAGELRAMDASTPEARAARLRYAEERLRYVADRARFGTSWIPHILSTAVNLAGTYYLWLAHDRFTTGWGQLISGMAIAEAQILTRPTKSIYAAKVLVGPTSLTLSGSF